MKIGVIGFGERNFMPYVETYENEFKKANIPYDCIFWDRFNDDASISKNNNEYIVHIRCEPGINKFKKLIPMLKFKRQIEKILQREHYTHLVVLTTLPGVLIYKILLKNYSNKYILDIRDYSYEKYGWYRKRVEKLVANSYFTAISSNGFKAFLPKNEKIITCHNIGSNFSDENEVRDLKNKETLTIGFVGGIRYFEENCKFIKAFANNPKYQLAYIGKRNLDCDLEGYCKRNNIKNIIFKGEFKNEDKPDIYSQIDMINSVYGNSSLEVTTLLPNRLYDGILFKKPIIASIGTYLGEVVNKHKVGLTVDIGDNKENSIEKIDMYVSSFDGADFVEHCQKFRDEISDEQNWFFEHIRKFVNDETKE